MRFLLSTCALLLSLFITAQPRFTDSSFGNNGRVIENTSIPKVILINALLQPDGKTLMLAASEYNGINRTILIRYNTDGTPDVGFSDNGIADSILIPGTFCNPKAIRLQADGKILVCGDTSEYSGRKGFIIRYNADGRPDASFGTNGILYLPQFYSNGNTLSVYTATDMVVLPSGKITLLSNASYTASIALIQITGEGKIDSSFGTNGIALTNPPGNLAYTRLRVLPDGKYVAGGSTGTSAFTGNRNGYVVTRLLSNGNLDSTYGNKGSAEATGGPTSDALEDMIVQPDGKVILSGSENAYASSTYTTVIRITVNGAVDAAFGSGGKKILSISANNMGATQSHLALQADGKILLNGIGKNNDGNYTMAVARLTTFGTLDAGFGSSGVALLQVNGYGSYGYIPLLQNDGKIIIAGFASDGKYTSLAIGRFTATSQTDGSLNAALTLVLLNNGSSYDDGMNILIQPADQKIVSVRERINGYDYTLCVSRHLPGGSPDSSFGINGTTYIDMPGTPYYNYNNFSGISSDGKITIIPYYFDFVSAGNLAVFRLQANGQPDSSFGLNGKKIFKSRNTDTIFNSMRYAIVQPDGKTLIATGQHDGPISNPNVPDSTFLIRLNVDGSFDNSFGIAGRKFISTSGSYLPLALQNDGKILLSISSGNAAATPQTTLKRFNANGSTDATFHGGQDKLLNISATQMVVQPNGKILLSSYRKNVARLLTNGNIDTTFATGGIFDATRYNPKDGYDYDFNIAADSSKIMLMTSLYDNQLPSIYYSKIIALKNNGSPDSTFGEAGVAVPDFLPTGNGYGMALQANGKVVVIGDEATTTDIPSSGFILTRLKSTNAPARLYTFTGNGLWSNAANWQEGTVPPATIPAGSSIVIDPPANSECVIDIPVRVQSGASVIIKAGKKVRLPGNLILQ